MKADMKDIKETIEKMKKKEKEELEDIKSKLVAKDKDPPAVDQKKFADDKKEVLV